MKNNKNIKFIIITIIISIVISFLVELAYFNRKTLTKNNSYQASIIETKDIEKQGNWYKSTSDSAYLIFKTKENYVNKLKFDYSANTSFKWSIEYQNASKEIITIDQESSNVINKTTRQLNDNTKEIKVNIKEKNIKIKNIEINNYIYLNWSRIIFFIVSITLFVSLIKFRTYFCKHLEKAFLLIALTTGILLILVSPKTVYTSWDDQIHIKSSKILFSTKECDFSQAFQLLITKSELKSEYFQSQEEQIELYTNLNKIHEKTKNREIQVNNYGPRYSKIIYLPFYLGFKLADTLNLNFITGFILAKLLNLLLYVAIMYFAIKISKSVKKIVFIIGLLISNLFLATQFSYDPTITASLILSIALFIRMLEEKQINYKYIIAFILAIIWASLPKAVYCPLLLLLLFIPNDKFKTKKQALQLKGLIIIVTILLMSTFIMPFFLGSVGGDSRGGNTSASGQLSFILHNPLQYSKVLLKFFILGGPDLFLGPKVFVGTGYLTGYTEIATQLLYIVNLIFILYVAFTTPMDKKVISNKIKIIFTIAMVGIWLLISTALYMSFTEVGSSSIEGVQPRYFIFMLLPLLLVLAPTTKKETKEEKKNSLLLIIPFIMIITILFLLVYKGRGF